MKFCGMCFNWKVVAALAAVGFGVWAIAPGIFGAAGPLLIALACPLSMLFMMRGMTRSSQTAQDTQAGVSPALPLMGQTGQSRDEQLAELRIELERVRTRQEALAREMDELAGAPAVREAEAVARAARRRSIPAR